MIIIVVVKHDGDITIIIFGRDDDRDNEKEGRGREEQTIELGNNNCGCIKDNHIIVPVFH